MPRFIGVRFFGTVLAGLLAASCGGGGGDSGPAQPTISGGAPSGTTGVPYPAFPFSVTSGGTAPFSWSETGALPPGLSFNSSGQLSGTPDDRWDLPHHVTTGRGTNPALPHLSL